MESIRPGHPGALQNDLGHFLPVPLRKTLADLYVKEIVLKIRTVYEAQILRDRILLRLPGDLFERSLYLFSPALLFIGADDLIALLKILFLALIEVDGQLLVEIRDLLSEVAASVL